MSKLKMFTGSVPPCFHCGGSAEWAEHGDADGGQQLFKLSCTCCSFETMPMTEACSGAMFEHWVFGVPVAVYDYELRRVLTAAEFYRRFGRVHGVAVASGS